MPSVRTEYRRKRVSLVKDCIVLLLDMLSMEKQTLEKVKLPFFKKLKKTIENREFEKTYSSRYT